MKSNYSLGSLIFLITDSEQLPRIITSIKFSLDGGCLYGVANGINESFHYDGEMTSKRNMEVVLGIHEN
jgi:hypothetical protein